MRLVRHSDDKMSDQERERANANKTLLSHEIVVRFDLVHQQNVRYPLWTQFFV